MSQTAFVPDHPSAFWPDQSGLEETQRLIGETLMDHIEMFACAYYKVTRIDPRDAVLVQEMDDNKIKWYFTTRGAQ